MLTLRICYHWFGLAAFTVGLFSSAWADTIETKNGARLVGKVTAINASSVTLETDYAGSLTVKSSEVLRLQTDAPLTIRLAGGTTMAGTVKPMGDGKIEIKGDDGTITTTLDKVATTWAPGAPDPAVAALDRKWKYEAAADVTGKNGNSEQLGTAVSARARLAGPHDALLFYTAYNRQETDNKVSSNQFKAGVDYADNFSGKKSWYVRDEGGFDRVKDIDLYNIAASGLGYDFIKDPLHILTGRAGLSFRYEGYKNPKTEDVKSLGLDFGINHEYTFGQSRIVNRLSYIPAFDDFMNFRVNHESFYEIPLASLAWKLRLGISNDYNSQPGTGVKKLDTNYFMRLVLNWE